MDMTFPTKPGRMTTFLQWVLDPCREFAVRKRARTHSTEQRIRLRVEFTTTPEVSGVTATFFNRLTTFQQDGMISRLCKLPSSE